jgi:hypothetical protein
MSLLLALTASAGGGVSADLDVTDASDTLAASVTLESLLPEQPVSLGGRNKLLDVATRRVRVALSVTDDSDQVYAAAKVAQVLRVAKVQSLPTPRAIAHAALDDADSVGAKSSTYKGSDIDLAFEHALLGNPSRVVGDFIVCLACEHPKCNQ